MTIGNKLKILRALKGLSQENILSMVKISDNTYRKMERDQLKPSKETLAELAKVYGLTVEQFEELNEKNILFYDSVKSEEGGFAYGVVNNYGVDNTTNTSVIALKIELEAKNQRIEDLTNVINIQKGRIEDLEEIIKLLKIK